MSPEEAIAKYQADAEARNARLAADRAPRAYTVDEARVLLLRLLKAYAKFWAEIPGKTPLERTEGLLHSILVVIDGEAIGYPGLHLTIAEAVDNIEYYRQRGENWLEPGMCITDEPLLLHEQLVQVK